ncbi:MAG: MFS transporter [Treponemataceae bacterium]|nr:MFS transporter [Treponemataceae bacterium]
MVKGREFSNYFWLTFLIGSGFFTMGLMDSLYDTYVPIFLKRYISSTALVGAVMTLDNVLQLFLIPIVALWSDRTRTPLGRRLPFIVVMLPVSGILFSLIPFTAALSLGALIGILFLFNVFKTSVRGPVVALMPDTIPGEYRSEANGVINTMGGIGLIIGTLFLARLMNRNELLPFGIAGALVLLAVVVLLLFVRERTTEPSSEERVPLGKAWKELFSSGDRSVIRILLGIFFWFMAYEGVKPFLGLYLVQVMKVSQGSAALAQGVAGIASVLLAIPSGYLAHRRGRKRLIRMSLLVLALILVLVPFTAPLAQWLRLPAGGSLILFLFLMFLYGSVWIGVVVNSFPMLWQMAHYGNIGMYTGLYYTFSQTAAITAPPITGAIIDLAGYPGIFLFGACCMLVARGSMGGVSRGEAEGSPLNILSN